MSNIQPSISGFYGRVQERAWLRGLFEEVADVDHETGRSRGGPKLAVIVANTGLGKSRLVQTLYQELTV
ncbi:MAG: ATP-binding protein, partial [Phycisphaerae bacterium]|nr:ATP-binding protein [Phycisphaerae bacterium]